MPNQNELQKELSQQAKGIGLGDAKTARAVIRFIVDNAQAIAAREREACAQVADALSEEMYTSGETYESVGATAAANRIRARSEWKE